MFGVDATSLHTAVALAVAFGLGGIIGLER